MCACLQQEMNVACLQQATWIYMNLAWVTAVRLWWAQPTPWPALVHGNHILIIAAMVCCSAGACAHPHSCPSGATTAAAHAAPGVAPSRPACSAAGSQLTPSCHHLRPSHDEPNQPTLQPCLQPSGAATG